MLVLGPLVAFVVDHHQLHTPDADPAFLILQLVDALTFGVVTAAGLVLRAQSAVHHRLMLLGAVFISDAGFSRWTGDAIAGVAGNGFWGFGAQFFAGDVVLVAALIAYDLLTRRRLLAPVAAAMAFGVASEALVCWFYVSPWWKAIAIRLLTW
jgi:hypothetical protein